MASERDVLKEAVGRLKASGALDHAPLDDLELLKPLGVSKERAAAYARLRSLLETGVEGDLRLGERVRWLAVPGHPVGRIIGLRALPLFDGRVDVQIDFEGRRLRQWVSPTDVQRSPDETEAGT